VLIQLGLSLTRLAIVGLLAIGLSGALAAGMGLAFGKPLVSGDPPGFTYTADRCADFAEYAPGAASCEEAATRHHFDEVVTYRGGAGVLGLLLLIAYLWARRRLEAHPFFLPEGFEATVGATLFGAAAAFLLASSLEQVALGATNGAGEYLSGGIVAVPIALAYGFSLYRALLRRSINE
jgi:hypothetical protein